MKQQTPAFQAQPKKHRIQSLLMLIWMGLSGLVGQGAFTRSTASELTIPESSAPPLNLAPEPAAPAAPEPTAAAPEPAPEKFSSAPIVPEPVSPAAQAPAAAPVPQASEPYIDTKDYSVGATEPYTAPNQVVVNERSSGCQATLAAGQVVSASLCAAPAAAAPNYAAPLSQSTEQPPAWASANAIGRADESGVSAKAIQSTLQYSAVPPQNLAVKPLTGANPLKWILNGERMIFPLPIPVDITSIFGWRSHPITGEWRFHSGTDLGAPMGTPVLAAYSGRVSLAEALGGYGLSILLDHSQGKQETRYAHLSEIFVKPGQWVQQGTVIGLVGSTGNSTGPHLHFETLQATPDGMVAVDPGMELQSTLTQLAKALQTARLTATTQPTEKQRMENKS